MSRLSERQAMSAPPTYPCHSGLGAISCRLLPCCSPSGGVRHRIEMPAGLGGFGGRILIFPRANRGHVGRADALRDKDRIAAPVSAGRRPSGDAPSWASTYGRSRRTCRESSIPPPAAIFLSWRYLLARRWGDGYTIARSGAAIVLMPYNWGKSNPSMRRHEKGSRQTLPISSQTAHLPEIAPCKEA